MKMPAVIGAPQRRIPYLAHAMPIVAQQQQNWTKENLLGFSLGDAIDRFGWPFVRHRQKSPDGSEDVINGVVPGHWMEVAGDPEPSQTADDAAVHVRRAMGGPFSWIIVVKSK